jgi:hypothetical protein
LNKLHILLQQLQRKDLSAMERNAATTEFFATIDKRRDEWTKTLSEMQAELVVLRKNIEKQRALWDAQPKKFSKEEEQAGLDEASKRIFVQLDQWQREEKEYSRYLEVLQNLLNLSRTSFDAMKIKIDEVIPKDSMGDRNNIYQLQNYIVGLGPAGLVLNTDGSVNAERSFVRINYFNLLHSITVRNSQPEVLNKPIDIIATRLPSNLVSSIVNEPNLAPDAVWVTCGSDKQALLLFRNNEQGELSIRYQPIKNLSQSVNGQIQFDELPWQPGLPLRMFEDPMLSIGSTDRKQWLSQWHTETEWLEALHQTAYSNGLIGLNEEMARHPNERLSTSESGLTSDQRINREFIQRQRDLCESEMLVVANNHWNFDVRGFNPGGNHGSFFRISTHSVFMIAGGKDTGIGQARTIERPYDSLSFVPTLLALIGDLRDDSTPVPALWEKGFRRFPGRIINELVPGTLNNRNSTATGANASP